MAQSGYTPIQIYYSPTATNVPLAANLVAGELAINTADGKLFYKDSSNVVQVLATKGSASGVFTSITDSALTSGRVTYAGTGGLLQDSANLTFNGTSLTIGSGGLTLGTGQNLTWGGTYGAGIPTLDGSSSGMDFYPAGSTSGLSMRLDSSGNLGLGVTPSAWSTYKALQIGDGALYASSSGNIQIAENAYYDGTNFKYINTAQASRYYQSSGAHAWFNAPSGTAGTNITFTQAMTLDASGNLGIGTNSPGAKLSVVGTGYSPNINLTDAATIAWDTSTGQTATFTFVSTNRTMGAPTNLVNGGFYALAVIQNGGSNTLTWNSVFKWAGGSAPTLSTAAGAKDYFVFRSDGTNLYEQGRALGDA